MQSLLNTSYYYLTQVIIVTTNRTGTAKSYLFGMVQTAKVEEICDGGRIVAKAFRTPLGTKCTVCLETAGEKKVFKGNAISTTAKAYFYLEKNRVNKAPQLYADTVDFNVVMAHHLVGKLSRLK